MLRFCFLFVLISCTSTTTNIDKSESQNGSPPQSMRWRQCSLPAWIILDDGLSTYEPVVIAAIKDWNDSTQTKLFTYGGVSDVDNVDVPAPFFTITQNDLGNKCGHTKLYGHEGNMCVWSAKIEFSFGCFDSFSNTIRHEFGHLLGLADVRDAEYNGIMYFHVRQAAFISKEEAEMVRSFYINQ